MTYFEFERNGEKWVLPVYKDSYMYKHPEQSFNWDKTIKFVREVTEKEYNEQFETRKLLKQLEFDF